MTKKSKNNAAWKNRTCPTCGKKCITKKALSAHIDSHFEPAYINAEPSKDAQLDSLRHDIKEKENKIKALEHYRDNVITAWIQSIADINKVIAYAIQGASSAGR